MEGTYMQMKVAENCPGYNPRYKMISASVAALPTSCSTCKNFINNKCVENLYDIVSNEINSN